MPERGWALGSAPQRVFSDLYMYNQGYLSLPGFEPIFNNVSGLVWETDGLIDVNPESIQYGFRDRGDFRPQNRQQMLSHEMYPYLMKRRFGVLVSDRGIAPLL